MAGVLNVSNVPIDYYDNYEFHESMEPDMKKLAIVQDRILKYIKDGDKSIFDHFDLVESGYIPTYELIANIANNTKLTDEEENRVIDILKHDVEGLKRFHGNYTRAFNEMNTIFGKIRKVDVKIRLLFHKIFDSRSKLENFYDRMCSGLNTTNSLYSILRDMHTVPTNYNDIPLNCRINHRWNIMNGSWSIPNKQLDDFLSKFNVDDLIRDITSKRREIYRLRKRSFHRRDNCQTIRGFTREFGQEAFNCYEDLSKLVFKLIAIWLHIQHVSSLVALKCDHLSDRSMSELALADLFKWNIKITRFFIDQGVIRHFNTLSYMCEIPFQFYFGEMEKEMDIDSLQKLYTLEGDHQLFLPHSVITINDFAFKMYKENREKYDLVVRGKLSVDPLIDYIKNDDVEGYKRYKMMIEHPEDGVLDDCFGGTSLCIYTEFNNLPVDVCSVAAYFNSQNVFFAFFNSENVYNGMLENAYHGDNIEIIKTVLSESGEELDFQELFSHYNFDVIQYCLSYHINKNASDESDYKEFIEDAILDSKFAKNYQVHSYLSSLNQ